MTYRPTLTLLAALLLAAACAPGDGSTSDGGPPRDAREDAPDAEPDVEPDGPEEDVAAEDSGELEEADAEETFEDAGPEDAAPPCEPEGINALRRSDDSILPLVTAQDRMGVERTIAFAWDGTTLEALHEDGRSFWTTEPGGGQLAGGFDFDRDGWPDAILAQSLSTGSVCGTTPTVTTWLSAIRGATGEVLPEIVERLPDTCWVFGGTVYPTSQWTVSDVLFGASSPTLALSPYYATTSWFASWDGLGFATEIFWYPSTSVYDTSYTADRPNPWGTGSSYLENSHVANGLIAEAGGLSRLVFFTSGRVVQYAISSVSAAQLLSDVPFLSGGRTDLAGRNYGLVALDPRDSDRVVLLAGASSYTVFEDMVRATMASDPWGQIERHVTVHVLTTGVLDDRFFSYAHDNSDGNQYEGRVVYPAGPFVDTGTGGPSRLAYNVYEGGHWYLHISQPGATADAQSLRGQFLWDVRDLDGDGTDEWIVSPVELPGDPDTPGWYFPRWRTDVLHWNESAGLLEPLAVHDGAIPYLVASFRRPDRSASQGYLYPVLTVLDEPTCTPQLVLRASDGTLRFEALP